MKIIYSLFCVNLVINYSVNILVGLYTGRKDLPIIILFVYVEGTVLISASNNGILRSMILHTNEVLQDGSIILGVTSGVRKRLNSMQDVWDWKIFV